MSSLQLAIYCFGYSVNQTGFSCMLVLLETIGNSERASLYNPNHHSRLCFPCKQVIHTGNVNSMKVLKNMACLRFKKCVMKDKLKINMLTC